ncbi:amino acid/amide ABC transporter membrane protein 1, HAAT family /amino acid/amide ABC transporter membrane protein 2, HAAT family /amino acid/amide ABC transporter ATP-binding protein 1, HAAT family [Thermomonospora echinospora]|uniref:Amino acid/amide ABC transporter membrane protein 1, HAAT family /amino acid/amide ABC transporter membrane protein 2, HAAT family /amino acid/amide ABC transporter ATP-binding protein 1, HAAT family n=1 Tax=Thermomonospora echinospora TaxID=1992 RepID=A0A1H6E7P2_9ACTN|nr:ATP-binding cassette domain-containing protein [Thermomonospora echinospora]SEG92964.1 amino acid/amide ABC transporter membrane protein 1, HAAT family /amino acid/amide ABC transporter membrane protein 2, HAAT family /amino acid/amide ABC transporter ATP-binding protein 1, HAAT family [Thermomonospora echinospora]
MNDLLTFLILGLSVGAVYALTAQGLVLIYRGSGVVNFAQGAYSMIGAFLFYRVAPDLGLPQAAAWPLALGVPALLGAATHLLLMKHLRRASALVRLVATLGVFALLVGIGYQLWGRGQDLVVSPLPHGTHHVFGAEAGIGEDRFWVIGIAAVLTLGLVALFRWTPFGRTTEAIAENPVAAAALGTSPDKVATANWVLGAVLASLAGILVAPILFLSVEALALIVLRSLAAALVGRFVSFWRTLAAALVIGVVETLLGRYIVDEGPLAPLVSDDRLLLGAFTAQSVSHSAAFLMIVVVLFVAGRNLPVRGELLDRLPVLGSGRIRLPGLLAAVAVTVVVISVVPAAWAASIQVSLAAAIICLSLVVVTGFTGQISLAQMGLAGTGAWIAGKLIQTQSWPFVPALIAAVVITTVVGVVIAVPALRTRGVNLALLTFGLSVVLSQLILQNPALTGGLEGIDIGKLNLFGWELDGFDHPRRLAFVTLAVVVVVCVAVANVRRSGTGLRLIALRSNERAAAALGLNSAVIKVYAFGLGAALAALGGVFLAFRQQNLVLTEFSPFSSVQLVVYTVIGGIGYVIGALGGGSFAPGGVGGQILHSFGLGTNALEIVSGAMLLMIILANPSGMAFEQVRAVTAVRERITSGKRRESASAAAPVPADAGDVPRAERPASARTLEVSGLNVRFGRVQAVDDVSLRVGPGEVVALIGPNGAGKTTVIDALTGFVSAERGGRIRLGDQALEDWSAARRAQAGLVRSFQSLELFEDLTVLENLLVTSQVPALRYVTDLVRPRRPRLTAAGQAAVQEFGLADDLDRFPGELPHGRRRLLAIARAVASDPAVLLLDEPAAGLGEEETAELARLIRRLADNLGIAVLVIEHDMSFVQTCADRIAVLNFGRLIADGEPEEVLRDPAVVEAYLGTDAQAEPERA